MVARTSTSWKDRAAYQGEKLDSFAFVHCVHQGGGGIMCYDCSVLMVFPRDTEDKLGFNKFCGLRKGTHPL